MNNLRRMLPLLLLVAGILLFSGVISSCSAPALRPVEGAAVATDSGIAQGVATEDHPVIRWLDIPYAEPPVG